MSLLLFRLFPFLTAGSAVIVSFLQWRHPFWYPWPLLSFFLWYMLAAMLLCLHRFSWREACAQVLPSLITVGALEGGFLFMESIWAKWVLACLLAGTSFLILELIFFLVFVPSRYPVNGLSRLNIALIPIALFFFAATSSGLQVFIRFPWWIVTVVIALMSFLFFFFTAHPSVEKWHQWRWGGLGAWVGLHVTILSFILPLGMMAQGALAALLIIVPLRLRRYAYPPVPSRRVAWVEGATFLILFSTLLTTSRWI